MQLISLGDLSLDIVIAPASGIATGSDVGGTVAFRVGGSAANVAQSFAVLGGKAVFVGAVGDDRIGRRLGRVLRDVGVKPRLVVAPGSRTARIAVVLGADGQRSFVTSRGAADYLAPSDLRRSWFRRADALHLPAYSLINEPLGSAARLAADWVHEAGGFVSVDLASAEPLAALGPADARSVILAVRPDIIFANEDEAAVLAGRVSDLAPIVVIKQGGAGCRIGDLQVPTKRVATTDTTGAGDAFDAGFLHALLSSQSRGVSALTRAAKTGHAAAAMLLTGARPGLSL